MVGEITKISFPIPFTIPQSSNTALFKFQKLPLSLFELHSIAITSSSTTTNSTTLWSSIILLPHVIRPTMSLLSRFFYKRPPDGLLEFIDRVYGKHTHQRKNKSHLSSFPFSFPKFSSFSLKKHFFFLNFNCSFRFMLLHRSVTRRNVPALPPRGRHGAPRGVSRIFLPRLQLPRRPEAQPIRGVPNRVRCCRHGLPQTVRGGSNFAPFPRSALPSRLW